MLVYAYEQGGATTAGLVALVQLVPAAIFAPFGAAFADRRGPARVLTLGYVAQAVAMAATAVALFAHGPPLLAYVLAAVAATAVTLTRPAQAALAPALARIAGGADGDERRLRLDRERRRARGAGGRRADARASSGPGLVFAVMAGAALAAALLVAPVQGPPPSADAAARRSRRSPPGSRLLAAAPEARALVGLLGAQYIVDRRARRPLRRARDRRARPRRVRRRLPQRRLRRGRRPRARRDGRAGRTGPLARRRSRSASPSGRGSLVLLGDPADDDRRVRAARRGGRRTEPASTWRAGRCCSGARRPSCSRASSACSRASRWPGLPSARVLAPALVALGGARARVRRRRAAAAASSLLLARRVCCAVDRRADVPVVEIALLRSLPLFAPLAGARARGGSRARSRRVERRSRDEAVVREGEPGDRFYVVADGELEVAVGGRKLAVLGAATSSARSRCFADVPRTATVARATPARLLRARPRGRSSWPSPGTTERARAQRRTGSCDERLADGENGAVIDPLERWREFGEKPDYAGLLTFAGLPYTQDPARARGRRRRDRRRADRRPRLRPARARASAPRAIRAASCPPGPHLEAKVDAFAELRDRRLRRRAGAARRPGALARGDRAHRRRGARRGRDPDRPRRRPLDRRAGHPRVRERATARSGSIHFDTHTDTGREVFGVEVSHGTPMLRLVEAGTSSPSATCRSGCAATGRAS